MGALGIWATKVLFPWRAKLAAHFLTSGNTVYESAAGSGLSLLMLAEVAAETAGVQGLRLFASDLRPEGVSLARSLLSGPNLLDAGRAFLGRVCVADSTDLSFAPAGAFDLVFTGYIDPLVFPKLTPARCKSARSVDTRFIRAKQREQEDWIASWVSEMVRLVTPGKVVVVENVGYPFCSQPGDEFDDWGGVTKEWWRRAITQYGWLVDPDSMMFEDMPISEKWDTARYHVAFRRTQEISEGILKTSAESPARGA